MQHYPDGGYWAGQNFVFDKREAVGVDDKNGVGGIVVKDRKNMKANDSGLSNNENGNKSTNISGDIDNNDKKRKIDNDDTSNDIIVDSKKKAPKILGN